MRRQDDKVKSSPRFAQKPAVEHKDRLPVSRIATNLEPNRLIHGDSDVGNEKMNLRSIGEENVPKPPSGEIVQKARCSSDKIIEETEKSKTNQTTTGSTNGALAHKGSKNSNPTRKSTNDKLSSSKKDVPNIEGVESSSADQQQSCSAKPGNQEDASCGAEETQTPSSVAETFPQKLYRILEEADKDGSNDIISFFPGGRAFAIHKPRQFVAEVMPKYFTTSRMSSFQRQLNLYGFRRITDGEEKGGYFHEKFLQGKKELCAEIKRKKSNVKPPPNFFLENHASGSQIFSAFPSMGVGTSQHQNLFELQRSQADMYRDGLSSRQQSGSSLFHDRSSSSGAVASALSRGMPDQASSLQQQLAAGGHSPPSSSVIAALLAQRQQHANALMSNQVMLQEARQRDLLAQQLLQMNTPRESIFLSNRNEQHLGARFAYQQNNEHLGLGSLLGTGESLLPHQHGSDYRGMMMAGPGGQGPILHNLQSANSEARSGSSGQSMESLFSPQRQAGSPPGLRIQQQQMRSDVGSGSIFAALLEQRQQQQLQLARLVEGRRQGNFQGQLQAALLRGSEQKQEPLFEGQDKKDTNK